MASMTSLIKGSPIVEARGSLILERHDFQVSHGRKLALDKARARLDEQDKLFSRVACAWAAILKVCIKHRDSTTSDSLFSH